MIHVSYTCKIMTKQAHVCRANCFMQLALFIFFKKTVVINTNWTHRRLIFEHLIIFFLWIGYKKASAFKSKADAFSLSGYNLDADK